MKKQLKQIKRIGLIANPEKVKSASVLRQTARAIAKSGRRVLMDEPTAAIGAVQAEPLPDTPTLAKSSDLLIVFGGDGTMLRVAREVAGIGTPLMGFNMGGLGFLTAASSKKISHSLEKLWTNQYTIDSLSMIDANVSRTNKHLAVNDVVISRGTIPRLIEVAVAVDGEPLTRYRCDGIIISTPAGSTAYSLAAGGAVVAPDAQVFTITPICPHTLSNRSVIVSIKSTITVQILEHRADTFLNTDGKFKAELAIGDTVSLKRSQQKARLVRLSGRSFFETLRHKLQWSGSHV
ncbi:MAG: ATP-NAD kinase [Verrucomicrobiales bacterium]|nr:ATP-NAD kinase [Verrucomicrobiales bacterium]